MQKTDKESSLDIEVQRNPTVTIILSTRNFEFPLSLNPNRIASLIPKGIPSEIILIHCEQNAIIEPMESKRKKLDPVTAHDNETDIQLNTDKDVTIISNTVRGNFTTAIMKGLEMSTGKFVIVIDADYPYPQELVPKLFDELTKSPNSIIVASKHSKGKSIQKLPLISTILGKAARIIIRHGLKIDNVHDPLSGCFAFSRRLLENIIIEGKGNQLLLEILVRLKTNKTYSKIPVTEIPFSQKVGHIPNKLDFNHILSYSMAIWHLYRYGKKYNEMQSKADYLEQVRHKSIPFLSKAGRFFTVGASGFVINYLVSLLIANLVPNIWYIHATIFGVITSITSNFILNKIWTFEDRDFRLKHVMKQYSTFLALCGLGATIQISLTYVFFGLWHIGYPLALLLAVCVASISNFLLNKKLTFGEKIWG